MAAPCSLHEVNHIVRASATGGGYILTLLDQLISEGICSVFDEAAFPGPPNPWDQAVSKTRECVLWNKAEPLLGYSGFYGQWFFGGGGTPLDGIHYWLPHCQRLSQPSSARELGCADCRARNYDPGGQSLSAMLTLKAGVSRIERRLPRVVNQQQRTTPHSRRPRWPPAPEASWDDDEAPSSAASRASPD